MLLQVVINFTTYLLIRRTLPGYYDHHPSYFHRKQNENKIKRTAYVWECEILITTLNKDTRERDANSSCQNDVTCFYFLQGKQVELLVFRSLLPQKTKSLQLALCAREKIWVRLVGKAEWGGLDKLRASEPASHASRASESCESSCEPCETDVNSQSIFLSSAFGGFWLFGTSFR